MTVSELPSRELPDSMELALLDYFLSGAVRLLRGEDKQHHTMMVHTKHTIEAMTPLVRRISRVVDGYCVNLEQSRSPAGRALAAKFQRRWESSFVENGCSEDWLQVKNQLFHFVNRYRPRIFEINMDSGDTLDFDDHQGQGLRAIVVGGNRLSRGLTIEGLSVSFFVRPTKTHDTLMQMARWFGFRERYADLIRLHVTEEIFERFEGMVEVERLFRDEVERYEQQAEFLPEDFGVPVLRQARMMPTRPSARQGARLIGGLSCSDQTHPYTRNFHFDQPALLENNLEVFANFVGELGESTRVGGRGESFLWMDVPPEQVITLIGGGGLCYPVQGSWQPAELCEYIAQRQGDELSSWRVAVIGLQDGNLAAPFAGFGLPEMQWVLPTRGRAPGRDHCGYNPGGWDFRVDLPGAKEDFAKEGGKSFSYNKMWERRAPQNPLLLAYIFDKNSRPTSPAKTTLFRDGETPVHLLSLCVALPRTAFPGRSRREWWIREGGDPLPGYDVNGH